VVANYDGDTRPARHRAQSGSPRRELADAMIQIKIGAGSPSLESISERTYALYRDTSHLGALRYDSVHRNTVQKVFSTTDPSIPGWKAFRSVLCVLGKTQAEADDIKVLWSAAKRAEKEQGEATQEIDRSAVRVHDHSPLVIEAIEALRDGRAGEAVRDLQKAMGVLLSEAGFPPRHVAAVGQTLFDAQVMQGRWTDAAVTARRTFLVTSSPGLAVRHWLVMAGSALATGGPPPGLAMIRDALDAPTPAAPADRLAPTVRHCLLYLIEEVRPSPVRPREMRADLARMLLRVQAATSVFGPDDRRSFETRFDLCALLLATVGSDDERLARERTHLFNDLAEQLTDATGAILALRYRAARLGGTRNLEDIRALLFPDGELAPASRLSVEFALTLCAYSEVRRLEGSAAEVAATANDLETVAKQLLHAAAEMRRGVDLRCDEQPHHDQWRHHADGHLV
jgi:hypothetical protein